MRLVLLTLAALGAGGCNQIFGLDAGSGGGDDDVDPPGDGGLDGRQQTFAPPIEFTVGLNPVSLAVGQLDRDPGADLAVAAAGTNNVFVVRCNPARQCTQTAHGVGLVPTSVVILNIGFDAAADLAVANFNGASISPLEGNGAGSFTSSTPVPHLAPYLLGAGNLAGDPITDLLVAGMDDTAMTVYPGVATGGYGPPVVTTIASPINAIATAQFIEEGPIEVVAADGGAVRVYEAGVTGSLSPLPDTAPGPASAVYAADVDSDDDTDLVVAYSSGDVRIWRGDGAGALTPASFSLVVDAGAHALGGGDADGDGEKDDLVVAARGMLGAPKVSIFYGNNDDSMTAGPVLEPEAGVTQVALADVDGDGLQDLVMLVTSLNHLLIAFGEQADPPSAPRAPPADAR